MHSEAVWMYNAA